MSAAQSISSLHVNLARGWRGGERQTLLLLQGLREVGEHAELLARADEPLAIRAAAQGIRVHHRPGVLFRASRRGFQIVHAHEAKALQWAAIATLFNRTKLVATRRVDNEPGRGWATRFKYHRTDQIVAVSNYVRSVMTSWGADPGRIRVIMDAVPPKVVCPDSRQRAELRSRFHGDRVIGFTGALVNRHKDPLTLIRAFHRLRQHDERLALLIVGDGPDRPVLENWVAQHDVGGVSFAGFVDDPDIYYACMDLFVLPSRMEGLGSAVLEAFAWGLPVVAARAGALPEIVREGETGLLFEPQNDTELAERLKWLLDRPDAQRALVAGGTRLLREQHVVPIMVAAYRDLYRRLAV